MLDRVKLRLGTPKAKNGAPEGGKGQSLVEMAIITPLLLLLFIGVLEVGWAIRGYIVLVNADREATRFAARGQYLDFSQTERDAVGYGAVLSHTLNSMSQQLDFDVVSDDPNGTLIISHYLVDTGKPCFEPPCNDDCAADNNNKHGGCDCSTPERREPDFSADDRVFYPSKPGFEHFTALYGIPQATRLNDAQIVAELKDQNDAFNCALNIKDPTVPWSPNSVVIVESFFDQPQLLGVPVVSNYLTDPIPLYAHTMMRITSDRGKGGGSDGKGCELLPIAVHISTLEDLPEHADAPTGDLWNGAGDGNFGWLRWTDDTVIEDFPFSTDSEEYLAQEILYPELSMNDYREPEHKDHEGDTVINAGDWVWGSTGVVTSNEVRDQLDAKTGQVFLFPVWDVAQGSGSNLVYRIHDFAWIRLDGYDLNSKKIWGTFMEWDKGSCKGNGH